MDSDTESWLLKPYASKLSGGYIPIEKLNLFPEIALLANDSPIPAIRYLVRPVSSQKIDFTLVRRWLSLCEARHRPLPRNPCHLLRLVPSMGAVARPYPTSQRSELVLGWLDRGLVPAYIAVV